MAVTFVFQRVLKMQILFKKIICCFCCLKWSYLDPAVVSLNTKVGSSFTVPQVWGHSGQFNPDYSVSTFCQLFSFLQND